MSFLYMFTHVNFYSTKLLTPQLSCEEFFRLKAAEKAVEIEPNLGSAYDILGYVKMLKANWIKAELYFSKAIDLMNESPSIDDDLIISYYTSAGNFKKANELLEQIRKDDPLNQSIRGWYMLNLAFLGNLQGAEDEYKRCKATFGDNEWHNLVISSIRIGYEDAITQDKIVYSDPVNNLAKKYLGSPEEGLFKVRNLYNKVESQSARILMEISEWATYFGDSEFALEAAEKSININSSCMFCLWLPIMKDVRQLPRFKEFVREIGLVDYWKEYGWPDNNICHPVGDDDFVCD